MLHCMFKSDVNLNTRKIGYFILKRDEMCHYARAPLPLIMHDRVMVLECLVLHLLSLHTLKHKPLCNEIALIGCLSFKFTIP